MSRVNLSSHERRKAELAGQVVLRTLDLMPSAAFTGLLLEVLEAGIHDPEDRALFGFPPRKKPGGSALPVVGGPPPAPLGGAPAYAGMVWRR